MRVYIESRVSEQGLSQNQTLQAKQRCVELKDSQPALVPLRKVVFTTEFQNVIGPEASYYDQVL